MTEQPEHQPQQPADRPQQPTPQPDYDAQQVHPQAGYQAQAPQHGYIPQQGYPQPGFEQQGYQQSYPPVNPAQGYQPGYQQQDPGYPPQPGGYQPQGQFQQPGGYQPQGQFQQPGGYQPQGQFQQPGFAPVSAAPTNDIGALFNKWLASLTQIFSGKTDLAEETIATNDRGEREYPFWAVAAAMSAGIYVIMMILATLILDARLGGYYELGSSILRSVFLPIVMVGALISLRALVVKAIFGMHKQQIGFQESANIVAIGFVAMVPYSLFLLINSAGSNEFISFIGTAGQVFFLLLAELLIYKSLTNRGNFTKPIILPYAGMTAGLIAVLQLLLILSTGSGSSLGLF